MESQEFRRSSSGLEQLTAPSEPKLLILDEPTLGLGPVILEQISKALERLPRRRT
jgi:ABC-type branched-subunit amino acid transport system ATPase component